jgi:hypothetical protein
LMAFCIVVFSGILTDSVLEDGVETVEVLIMGMIILCKT